jgi:hypothetical protein
LRLRGRQGLQFVGWRFDKTVVCGGVCKKRFARSAATDVLSPSFLRTTHKKHKYCYVCCVWLCVCFGHLVLGLASGLEAFSREPPCDSFGALAFRQTPETRGTAWEFLSYYPILPSRYLRDPFTTSCVVASVFHINMLFLPTPLPSIRRRSGTQKTAPVRFARRIFFSQFPAK